MVSLESTPLAKVLTTLDLTALGIGSTLGVGVYVLAGEAAKNYAGPAVVISFLIAAVASILSGLCYAEFGARVPKAGSAYVYSYVTIGEFMAFIIGWNLILEYIIGSASVVKGIFTYLDSLIGKVMAQFFREHMPIDIDAIAKYPDFFSFGVTILFSIALAFGAKESSMVNNVFTLVNLCVVIFVIISGFWNIDAKNWSLPESEVPAGAGTGGFAPYGISGIIKGAATCFYGFIGFDCIATAGEEAKTPQKSIPIAIVVSLLIVFLAYFGISTILTMTLPYFAQDPEAPFPKMYDLVGWPAAKYAVSVGAMCGLFSSLLGAMFPLPRIIYSMASDGLLFKFLAKVHPRFKTPFVGTLLAGVFTGTLSCIFELEQLFSMMSIGTLLAYSMVAACILILRYDILEPPETEVYLTWSEATKKIFKRGQKAPTVTSARFVTWAVGIFFVSCLALGGIVSQLDVEISNGEPYAIVLLVICAVLIVSLLGLIALQPKNGNNLTFHIPLVPYIPCISIIINTYLMTMLDVMTWVRFVIWIIIGLAIYFLYGIWNSNEQYSRLKAKEVKEVQKEGKTNMGFTSEPDATLDYMEESEDRSSVEKEKF